MSNFAYAVIVNGKPVFKTDDRARALEVSARLGGVVQALKEVSKWEQIFG